MTRILDAKYEKVDLRSMVQSCQHLTSEQRTELHMLLHKYEYLFDGTLGCWNMHPIDLMLKPGSMPYHAKLYPIPKVHEPTTRKECT
jgi:galactose-1-phosphate uridylyltransferase